MMSLRYACSSPATVKFNCTRDHLSHRFPRGSVGPEQLRAREAGADDHSLQTANWESVLGEFAAEAQSPAAQPHQSDLLIEKA